MSTDEEEEEGESDKLRNFVNKIMPEERGERPIKLWPCCSFAVCLRDTIIKVVLIERKNCLEQQNKETTREKESNRDDIIAVLPGFQVSGAAR